MDFDVSAEHREMIDSLERFIERELMPLERDARWVNEDVLPGDLLARVRQRSAELGFYAPDAPEDVGGAGLSQLGMVLLRERAYAHPSRLSDHAIAGPEGPTGLLGIATAQQRDRYVKPLVRAQLIRALAITEPDIGSDVDALTTRAEAVAGGWIINGRKQFITNAAEADFIIVLAKTAGGPAGNDGFSAFLVDKGMPGLHIGRLIPGMHLGHRQYEVLLEDCFVPEDSLLGGRANLGAALAKAKEFFAVGRLAIAAMALGLAQQALQLGLEYAKSRKAFGKPIAEYQHVQAHLVDSATQLRAARLLTYEAACRYDCGRPGLREAAMAKLAATETGYQVVDRMIQVHGGIGWTRDLPLERMLRSLRMYRIVDGTSELQKVIISRSLLGR